MTTLKGKGEKIMPTEEIKLYFATNRNHLGTHQWHPDGYGTSFSKDGPENLRFGELTLTADSDKIHNFLNAQGNCGKGDGNGMTKYFSERAQKADITAYEEHIDKSERTVKTQKGDRIVRTAVPRTLGSNTMFHNLHAAMQNATDALIYIHGFDNDWHDAVGNAATLQVMLNNSPRRDPNQNVLVILFSWPSDGQVIPLYSYKSDRTEAQASGAAVGRGFLKARDFLRQMMHPDNPMSALEPCGQDIHLLCHSMGNFLLEFALPRVDDHTPGTAMPLIFEHIFMCAPDVDDNVFEADKPLERLQEITRNVTVYHNRKDIAMPVSQYTKGNDERLGCGGAAHPGQLHNKIHQVDCTDVVTGPIKHSYYLDGLVIDDLRQSMDGLPQDKDGRRRKQTSSLPNVWKMTQG